MERMNGILVIDKPEGYTSFDVIAILRKKFGQKKVGHMGTLDPMATGVLPVLFGETAKFQVFSKVHSKKYVASLQLGITTSTLDITGEVISKLPSFVSEKDFKNVVGEFVGEIDQIPPMFSAVKQGGRKLCDLARKGIEVERKYRKINIFSLDVLDFNEKTQTAKIEIFCSQGTYVRTLCDDIGKKLGCGAVMTSLRRTFSNGFDLSQSYPLEKIKVTDVSEIINNYILSTNYLFLDNKKAYVSLNQATRFQNGGALSLTRIFSKQNFLDQEIFSIYHKDNFVGIGKVDKIRGEMLVCKALR